MLSSFLPLIYFLELWDFLFYISIHKFYLVFSATFYIYISGKHRPRMCFFLAQNRRNGIEITDMVSIARKSHLLKEESKPGLHLKCIIKCHNFKKIQKHEMKVYVKCMYPFFTCGWLGQEFASSNYLVR